MWVFLVLAGAWAGVAVGSGDVGYVGVFFWRRRGGFIALVFFVLFVLLVLLFMLLRGGSVEGWFRDDDSFNRSIDEG